VTVISDAELERYLARTGYRGPREPTLDVLHALTAAHTQSIPFENLSVLLGQRVDISDDAIFDKLVDRRRGGYCFEQNGLFLRVLEAFGFEVTPLAARVHMGRPRTEVPPRTHLCLRVQVAGEPWLTDVGVGGLSLTAAIRLEPDLVQATPHETRRIVRDGALYFHQARLGDEWQDIYQFTGDTMPQIDRELGNWYTSTHPNSHFRNTLMVARAGTEGRRYTVQDDRFKVRERAGHAHEQVIGSAHELLSVLAEHFELRFPEHTRFGSAGAPFPS
jgi:N-hydroxyarylamine O-acetyltransferase